MLHAEEKPLTVKALNVFIKTLQVELEHTNLLPDTKDCFMRDLADLILPIAEHDAYQYRLDYYESSQRLPETITTLRDLALRAAGGLHQGYMQAELSEEVAIAQLQQVYEKACRAAEKAMAGRGRE